MWGRLQRQPHIALSPYEPPQLVAQSARGLALTISSVLPWPPFGNRVADAAEAADESPSAQMATVKAVRYLFG